MFLKNKEEYTENYFKKGSFLDKVEYRVWNVFYNLHNNRRRKGNHNEDFTLFCSMCYGGFIYHELGLKFRTPTINLFIRQKDFLKMISDPYKYMSIELEFEPFGSRYNYPVAMLGDVEIHFNHYKSNEEANDKWVERRKRINWENMYVIMIEREGISYEDIVQFDQLSYYKNKVIFTCQDYPEIKSACFLKCYKKSRGGVQSILRHVPMSGLRVADKYFDYVKFLNK